MTRPLVRPNSHAPCALGPQLTPFSQSPTLPLARNGKGNLEWPQTQT